jgi:plasmid stabilization system protein ParE
MASYRLSEKADEDLSRLYEYGILHNGQERADRYYNGLIEQFEELAENPGFGRLLTISAPDIAAASTDVIRFITELTMIQS